jgi:integrase/recombinase XerD
VTAPVEYAVAVDAYLGQAPLSAASRRVYRISLAGWAWPLVGRPIPAGTRRRGAAPPVVPLALLDDPGTAGRLAEALADRAAGSDARTVNRELSALRGAVSWWQDLGWIRADPTAGLRHRPPDELAAPLDAEQAGALFRLPASLREQAFWRLLYDSGAPGGPRRSSPPRRGRLTRPAAAGPCISSARRGCPAPGRRSGWRGPGADESR